MRSPAFLANMPRSIERGGATFSPNYLQDDECHKSFSALTAVLTLCYAPSMWNQKLVQYLDPTPKDSAPIMTPGLTGCQKIFLFLQILDGGRHVELSTFVLISQWNLDPPITCNQILKPSDISDFLKFDFDVWIHSSNFIISISACFYEILVQVISLHSTTPISSSCICEIWGSNLIARIPSWIPLVPANSMSIKYELHSHLSKWPSLGIAK